MLAVLVELHDLLELEAVEVAEQVRLRRARRPLSGPQVFDQRLRRDLLLDEDWDGRNGEIVRVLLVLALPDELRVERRVARYLTVAGAFSISSAKDSSSAVGMFLREAFPCFVASTLVGVLGFFNRLAIATRPPPAPSCAMLRG